ncbi:hypothetical protein ACFQU2_37235 [Siccirubricoccus deserti]|uniref:Uncharacterized protein n=1 Tax=Siccirubricoccus deserti TaxID=2013562 RepID=A0A9X0R508_9PROT|nr:hypothetical protein [Siccirubricoccus deserti]MBC4019035.1 hypothetical protein [Siccirubricoccus deserti]
MARMSGVFGQLRLVLRGLSATTLWRIPSSSRQKRVVLGIVARIRQHRVEGEQGGGLAHRRGEPLAGPD